MNVNEILLELFRAHGVEAVSQGDWLVLPNQNMRSSASVVSEKQQPNGMTVQLDVRLEIAPQRTIIESFVGWGETREKAVANGIENFASNSFHVLLAAFFQPHDEQVVQEEWVIGGRTSRVTVGNIGVRGKLPVQGDSMFAWFKRFEEKIKEQQLRPGIHWVRLYYGQMQGKMITVEVLLDNDVWEGIDSEMAAVEWASGDAFYSVRVFVVIEVRKGGLVTPETAVAWFADIVAPWHEFNENEAFAAMADAGIPDALADRAFKFTQVAWGRALLAGLGVTFSPTYLCFNASGKVVESGNLAEEPCFATAARLAQRYRGAPGFRRLALMSADVNATNNALNGGSKPENIVTSPAFLFLEAPTATGVQTAQQIIAQQMAALSGSSAGVKRELASAKPWWRLWQ